MVAEPRRRFYYHQGQVNAVNEGVCDEYWSRASCISFGKSSTYSSLYNIKDKQQNGIFKLAIIRPYVRALHATQNYCIVSHRTEVFHTMH